MKATEAGVPHRSSSKEESSVVAFVLAGSDGTRLRPLTAGQPKPMLPCAGRRIIDFVLSNLFNSGIRSIYVLAQHRADAIIGHVASAWQDTLREDGGFIEVVVPPPDGGRFAGTADAVGRNLHRVERHRADFVAVFAADHVYRMDVAQMVHFHERSEADATIAALPVPPREARAFGAMRAAVDGRIEAFEENSRHAVPMVYRGTHAYASMGNYVFTHEALRELLDECEHRGGADFRNDVLPRAVKTHRVFAYNFSDNRIPGLLPCEARCYWRDIGTFDSYRAAQEDTLGPSPKFRIDNPLWPIGGACAPSMTVLENAPRSDDVPRGRRRAAVAAAAC